MSNQVFSSRQVAPNGPIKYSQEAFYVLPANQSIPQLAVTEINFNEISSTIQGLSYAGAGRWEAH